MLPYSGEKDYADIHALVDPGYGGRELDIKFLGEKMSGLDFLREHIRHFPENSEALKNYGRMDAGTARTLYDNLLSLV